MSKTQHMKVPFSEPFYDKQEERALLRVLKRNWITSGPEVVRFEQAVKKYLQVQTAVAVASCTAALEIALYVLNIGPGDVVITTPYTFASTVTSIIRTGARPLLVDVDAKTFNIDPSAIAASIKSEFIYHHHSWHHRRSGNILKAILPVHFAGQACDMAAINRIASEYGLDVVEDAAHALGASVHGLKIGCSNNLVCFSFYSNKNVTTGEGGMIVTNRSDLEEKIRLYGLHGMNRDNISRYQQGLPFYDILLPGLKANLCDILASLGVAQMAKIERILRLRTQAAAWYNTDLASCEDIAIMPVTPGFASAWHLFPILLNQRIKSMRNDMLLQLRKKGIVPSVHFIPIHFHSYFKAYFKEPLTLPVSEDLFAREISLPIFPSISRTMVRYVANAVKEIAQRL